MRAWARAAFWSASTVTCLVACATSTPIPPTYTQEELRAACERHGAWWRPNDLLGGFCEYDSRL